MNSIRLNEKETVSLLKSITSVAPDEDYGGSFLSNLFRIQEISRDGTVITVRMEENGSENKPSCYVTKVGKDGYKISELDKLILDYLNHLPVTIINKSEPSSLIIVMLGMMKENKLGSGNTVIGWKSDLDNMEIHKTLPNANVIHVDNSDLRKTFPENTAFISYASKHIIYETGHVIAKNDNKFNFAQTNDGDSFVKKIKFV